jgi:cysteinyl-tRNA synthetase
MATKYLGAEFDIHTGGIDHVPVHHTNEIAQSENALGVRPWVRYWMHAGWLLMSGGKISKSAGRATTLDDLRNAGIGPMAFRYYMLTAHYRKPLEFSMEALRGASAAFERLRGTVREHSAPASASDDETSTARDHRTRFLEALADDLSAPRALAVLWNIVRDPRLGGVERAALVGELAPTLGLDLRGPGAERTEPRASDGTVERLLAERSAARQRRDFVLADALRAELQGLGVHLHDDRVNSDWSGGRDEHYGRDRQPKRVGNGHET